MDRSVLERIPNLRFGLWRSTTWPGALGIVSKGGIQPSSNEHQGRWTYPQTRTSLALRLGAVALFDFES